MQLKPPTEGSERWIKQRRWRRLTVLQRCLLLSLLIHLLLVFLFGLMVVSRQVVRTITAQREMTVELAIEMPEVQELLEQLRSAASELQVEDTSLETHQSQKVETQAASSRAASIATGNVASQQSASSNLSSAASARTPSASSAASASASAMKFDPSRLAPSQPQLASQAAQPLRENEQQASQAEPAASRRLSAQPAPSRAATTTVDVPTTTATEAHAQLDAPTASRDMAASTTEAALRPNLERAMRSVSVAFQSRQPVASDAAESVDVRDASAAGEPAMASAERASSVSPRAAAATVQTATTQTEAVERSMASAAAVQMSRAMEPESAARGSSFERRRDAAPRVAVGATAGSAARIRASEAQVPQSESGDGSGGATASRYADASASDGSGAASAATVSLNAPAANAATAGEASSTIRDASAAAGASSAAAAGVEGVPRGKGIASISATAAAVGSAPGSATGGRVRAAESGLGSGEGETGAAARLAGGAADGLEASRGVEAGVAPSGSTGSARTLRAGVAAGRGAKGAASAVAEGVGRTASAKGAGGGFSPTVSIKPGGGGIAAGEADLGSAFADAGSGGGATGRLQGTSDAGDATTNGRPGGNLASATPGAAPASRSLIEGGATPGNATSMLPDIGEPVRLSGRLVSAEAPGIAGAPILAVTPASAPRRGAGGDGTTPQRPSILPGLAIDEPSFSSRKLESSRAPGATLAVDAELSQRTVASIAPLTATLEHALPTPTADAPRVPTVKKLFDRTPAMRRKLVETMGGSKESEDAVARALAFLARNQESDGHWSHFMGDRSSGRNRNYRHDQALTGLATLCFLASDHTPDKDGPYRDTVARALDYLRRHQGGDGDLRGDGNMYSHAIATLALAEAAIMTGDEGLKDAAFRAANFICGAQRDKDGGWRYKPRQAGDTSVLGWQVLALHSVEFLGFDVPDETRTGAIRWLDSVASGTHGMISGYQSRNPRATMTAQATLSRMLLGQQLAPEQQDEACAYLLKNDPLKDSAAFYLWYYCSLTMMQMQNESWEQWNPRIRDFLVETQIRGGTRDGSWDPDSRYGFVGGRIYSTALATLTLEVYYRYLPMYQRAATPTTTRHSE